MSLPGQGPFPGQGWQPPRKRRRKAKAKAKPVSVHPRHAMTINLDLYLNGGADRHDLELEMNEAERVEINARADAQVDRVRERPWDINHPLAAAAQLGRYRHAAQLSDLQDPTDQAQVRAFEVARDRSRAERWGGRSDFWARGAGRDNRRQRRNSR